MVNRNKPRRSDSITMKFGIYIPNWGEYGDPHVLVNMARETEAAGWDGIFVWDHIRWKDMVTPVADPWIALAAIAAVTSRIRLGPTVTPLPRRRPWKLARETVTLDQLSNGRLTLGIGLGGSSDEEFGAFGDTRDPKVRAEELDEGLQVLTGLWKGEPYHFEGKHYQAARNAISAQARASAARSPSGLGRRLRNGRRFGVLRSGMVFFRFRGVRRRLRPTRCAN